MKSFEEWWSEHKKNGFVPTFSDVASNSFKVGQQSKQDGIDHLQKRIDDLKSFCIKGVESNMLSIEYNQALIDMHNILKGNTNDH